MPEQVVSNVSMLLNSEENQQIHKLLGNRCQSLSTAIVQLYITEPPRHNSYKKFATGVLCFVKDNTRKNYFFRLYCLQKNAQIWEHEMYEDMIYECPRNFLHVFEGEDGIIAFNFASPEESYIFKNQVINKIEIKRKKAVMRAQNQQRIPNNNKANYPQTRTELSLKKPGRKGKITKADIGNPTGFLHISHVGWNQNSGFDVNTTDEELKTLLDKAGVSEKHLRDKDTREFIYDFIAKHQSNDSVVETNRSTRKPLPTPNAAPVPPVPPRGPKPPQSYRAAPPPPPSRAPMIKTEKAPAPPPMDMQQSVAPPPPPPPPIFDNTSATTDSSISVASPTDNSALLASIRNGTNLKPVEERQLPPPNDARSDLLSEIRKGTTLKPVAERENKPSPPAKGNDGDNCDLAKALARALADRKLAITNSEDDDDDEDDSNDDEWD